MKKGNCKLSIGIVLGIVVSIAVLLVDYNYTLCGLIEEAMLAIFTGCLFAVPNGVLIVYEDIKRVREEQTELLSDLDVYFKDISIREKDNYNPEVIEKNRQKIVKLNKLLGKRLDINYLKKKEKEEIRKLFDEIYSFSISILELNEKYHRMSNNDFNNEVRRINGIMDSCINLIQEIQEQN